MKSLKSKKNQKEFFEFKSRPLVRKGSTAYYGDINEKYVVKMEIVETKKVKDLDVASRVGLMMIETSSKITDSQKIVKISEKNGLYPALDIAEAWLERAQ